MKTVRQRIARDFHQQSRMIQQHTEKWLCDNIYSVTGCQTSFPGPVAVDLLGLQRDRRKVDERLGLSARTQRNLSACQGTVLRSGHEGLRAGRPLPVQQ
jgi:hypothetical protein